MEIPSDFEAAAQAEERILREVTALGYDDAAVFAIKLALEEGLSNAIRHGNRLDRTKSVRLAFDITADRAVITITDQGGGFRPETVPDPTADENLEKPCGRGIMLMRAYMDEVHYNPQGNQLYMVKRRT